MQRSLVLLSAALSIHCGSSRTSSSLPAASSPAAPGAPATASPGAPPSVRLPRTFLPAQYAVRLAIDPKQPTFTGSIQIMGALSERSTTIHLHGEALTIGKAVAQHHGTTIPLTVTRTGSDVLALRAPAPLEPGTYTLAIEYTGELDTVNTTGAFKQTVAGESYVYTQLEAIYARRVFPCFDEPDNKVPWTIALDVPKAYVAVSNAPVASETVLDDRTKRVTFATTKPLPTYLVAFGVGPFEIVDGGKTKRGTPVRMVTLAGRAPEAAWAAKTTARMVDLAEDWFGTPYPYEKLDMLTIPLTVGFGAMENAGLVTFSEHIMLHDPASASQGSKRRWAVVGAHEIAHQWFGNLVTPVFWDDIWLNEGFANWLEYKITSKLDPAYRDEQSLVHIRHEALEADALVSARQVRQPIATADDIFNAFDSITYDKGSSVLSMFEGYLGHELFQRGVREYLAARAWGNATSTDFVRHIASAAKGAPANRPALDVEAAFATFLDQPGAPQLTATTTCQGGKPEIALAQQRYVPPGSAAPAGGTPWIVPVCVAFDKAGQRAEQCTVLATPTATLALDTRTCPRWVMPNVGGRGYYRNAYTTAQLVALRDEAWSKLAQAERMTLFFDVKEGARTGRVPLPLALSFVPKVLAIDDRHAVPPAVWFVDGLAAFVPDELRPKYEHYVRTALGPLATRAGFMPKDGESIDVEVIREETVGIVAKAGREPRLVDEAVRLADRWRDLPQAIRGTVLEIAADARPEVFDRLLRELATEPDRRRRREMIRALGSVRDVARQQTALALLLAPKRDPRELVAVLERGYTERNRDAVRDFVRTHADAIQKRLPSTGTSTSFVNMSSLFTKACRADQRDAIAAYVTERFGRLPGGARIVRNHIEDMDQCIARRKLVEPELRAWLAGLRLPKPDAKSR